ncbi:hypothetical protein BDV96DRAFT_508634 [Lophiotrema nucula]|uniref:C2H2-type domain-containing protein n=1 Tax=Lophiotrema nucula TaxID=690887 RepID=A0A6A5YFP3_9PLEO|nr:hypothetical protein BDV96DRAFT_508634 [Lophiotrema nucula]
MDVDQTTCEDSIEASSPPTSQDTSSTAVTSPSSTSSPRDPIGVSKTQFACSDCGLAFRTAGLRNKHVNRKHVRRFACTVADCTAAFHLSADLKRHQLNVHKETHDTGKTWMCTNQRCSNPNVVFKRKDNYTRHLLRCTGTAG